MDGEQRAGALALLARIVERSQRHEAVPFVYRFIRAKNGRAPLARLIWDGGGRGGEVRLKLYLCITLMATRHPHDIQRPPTPRAWARLLGLPPAAGARRVNNALRWLADRDLIALEPRTAAPDTITLRSADGDGKPYVARSGRYVSLPLGFWAHGWILDLSATGIALLLVLMELQGGRDGVQYVTAERREEYGLSPDTWTRATKELQRLELLTLGRTPQGDDEFIYTRMRNTFRIDVDRLNAPPPARALVDHDDNEIRGTS